MRSTPPVAALAAALALPLAACTEAPSGAPDEVLGIEWFEADPAKIAPGSRATLVWKTSGARSLSLRDTAGKELLVDGGAGAEGELAVWPIESTTYLLGATGDDGLERTARVRVEVIQPKPVIERFVANPDYVHLGQGATLWWIVRGADSVTVVDEAGREWVPEPGESRVEVKPDRSTVYTLIARGNGEAREFALVDMEPLPAVSATAWQDVVAAGSGFRLSWTSRGADRIEIRANGVPISRGEESPLPDPSSEDPEWPPSGSAYLLVEDDTQYKVTAFGPDGQASAFVGIRVRPGIELFSVFEAGPKRIGREVSLNWRVLGAHSLEIRGEGEVLRSWDAGAIDEGSARLPVGPSGRFELVATRGALESVATIWVPVTDLPTIDRFEASPVIAAPGRPEDTTVRWEVDGADGITLARSPGGKVVIPEGATEVKVAIEENTEFTLRARNEYGMITETTWPKVIPPPILGFSAVPARVVPGQEVVLSWSVSNHLGIRILRDGVVAHVVDRIPGDGPIEAGSWTDTVASDTTYELQAFTESGRHDTASVQVIVGPPIIRVFDAPKLVRFGQPVPFSWSCEGGMSMQISDSTGGRRFWTSNPSRIASGSLDAHLDVPGEEVFTLRVSDLLGAWDERSIAVRITDGPIISRFAANRAEVTVSQHFFLSWDVQQDANGRFPDLAIAGTGLADPLELQQARGPGAMPVIPTTPGLHRYTLTATTPGTMPATAEVEVLVRGEPD